MHAVHHCGAHADKRKMVISFSTRLRTEAWTARQGQLAGSKASYEVTKGMHTRCAAKCARLRLSLKKLLLKLALCMHCLIVEIQIEA